MLNPWVFILAFGGAVIYVAAALTLKRAAELGAGLWHSTWVSNILAALVFQSLLVLPGHWPPAEAWIQPAIVSLLFLCGQILTLFSLQKGDVSVATPVLGLKIILVALMISFFLRVPLSWQLWLAAFLSTLGIILLNRRGNVQAVNSNTGITVISAACAASCYATFDVLVQKWSPGWGVGTFLPMMMGLLGVFSLPIAFLFPKPLTALPGPALKWLVWGGILFAIQSLLLVSGIAHFGEATTSNVIYSSRGLLSVVAVSMIGHWFHNAEQKLEPQVLQARFIGAGFMFAAIILVLV